MKKRHNAGVYPVCFCDSRCMCLCCIPLMFHRVICGTDKSIGDVLQARKQAAFTSMMQSVSFCVHTSAVCVFMCVCAGWKHEFTANKDKESEQEKLILKRRRSENVAQHESTLSLLWWSRTEQHFPFVSEKEALNFGKILCNLICDHWHLVS